MALSYEIEVVKKAVKAGAEIVMLGDDYAYNTGPMISPKHFKEFVLPGLKKMVDVVHEMGAYCIKHSDGNLMKILDMIIETGIDGINPIDPIAGMDIQKIKKMYGKQGLHHRQHRLRESPDQRHSRPGNQSSEKVYIDGISRRWPHSFLQQQHPFKREA